MTNNNLVLTKLKNIRKSFGLSTAQMAKLLNISKAMYIYVENGKRRLSYDLSIKISKVFNLNPDDLFYDDFKEFYS